MFYPQPKAILPNEKHEWINEKFDAIAQLTSLYV